MAWNGSDGVKAPEVEKKPPKGFKGAIAGVVIVVAALVAFFGVRSLKSEAPEREAKKANIPEVQPVKPVKVLDQTISKPKKGAEIAAEATAKSSRKASEVKSLMEKAKEIASKKPKTRRVFERGVDQVIAMAVCGPEDAALPPLPDIGHDAGDEEFLSSVNEPVAVYDDDPEPIKKMKAQVEATRKEIVEMMASDKTLTLKSILEEHREQFNANLDIRGEAVNNLNDLVSGGASDDQIVDFVDKMNDTLRSMGIKELDDNDIEGNEAE